jgi:hypothetical protein
MQTVPTSFVTGINAHRERVAADAMDAAPELDPAGVERPVITSVKGDPVAAWLASDGAVQKALASPPSREGRRGPVVVRPRGSVRGL